MVCIKCGCTLTVYIDLCRIACIQKVFPDRGNKVIFIDFELTYCSLLIMSFFQAKKIFVFFPPSLNHLIFDRRIAPLVRNSMIFSSSLPFSLNCSTKSEFYISLHGTIVDFFFQSGIICSRSVSHCFTIFLLAAAYLSVFSITLSFITSKKCEVN